MREWNENGEAETMNDMAMLLKVLPDKGVSQIHKDVILDNGLLGDIKLDCIYCVSRVGVEYWSIEGPIHAKFFPVTVNPQRKRNRKELFVAIWNGELEQNVGHDENG